jgi:glyoxylase-like metal-dependent hydrolase (beta-lactamase superfamily II)
MEITKRTLLKGLAAAPALAAPALVLATTNTAKAEPAMAGAQVPGYYRYHVGDIEITALLDGYTDIPTQFVVGYDAQAARESTLKSYHRFNSEVISIPVNAYVIKTGKNTILLDAGGVTGFFPTLGKLAGNMKAAGIMPGDITDILLSHMHPDHIGALATAKGGKAFENATLTVSETEWNFIHSDDVRNAAPEEFRPMIDVARMVLAPYAEGKKMFSGETELFTGVTSLPLPGHTPGQSGYVVSSKGENLLFWGDVIHFTSLQFANPDWGVVFDGDVEQARKTRRALLERVSSESMAVGGSHVDFPGIGYVEKSGDGYRYVTAPWMPV